MVFELKLFPGYLLHAEWAVTMCLCLKLLDVRVPEVIDIREEAVLKCKFDLEGDELYSVKWYKEELEFFRYMPDNTPRVQTFPVDGVHVLVSEIQYVQSDTSLSIQATENVHLKLKQNTK
ncbi:hypothetical protein RUM43_007881 [Polyplax serrata]|uniref:Uncharacterized protein n=1 Tax=Polyplax serrata TaxID=468196 RepID=A0AAN8PMU4_POLSC